MKTLYHLFFVTLFATNCKFNRTATTKEFERCAGEECALNRNYDLIMLTKTLGEQTKVPTEKMAFHAEVLQGEGRGYAPSSMNVFTEMSFSDLTEAECRALKVYHSQGYKRPSEVDCSGASRRYFTTDFLPPAMQALGKHVFRSQKQFSGETWAEIMSNCWTSSYEITRHRATGGFDYSVFYVGYELVERFFQDPAYFEKVGESPSDSAREFVVKTAKPGDLVQFYNERIYHSAVVVAPGLVFEKSGYQSFMTFRLALLDDLLQVWGAKERVVLLRPTGKALPHPYVFRSGGMGGNTHDDGGSGQYHFIAQIPPFVKKGDERFHLPPEAYKSASFSLKSMPGFALKELKRIDKAVSVDCVTKGEAKLFESGGLGPSDKVIGTASSGTKFFSRYQYGSFYQLMSFTYRGKVFDPRAMNALWIHENDATCRPRETSFF